MMFLPYHYLILGGVALSIVFLVTNIIIKSLQQKQITKLIDQLKLNILDKETEQKDQMLLSFSQIQHALQEKLAKQTLEQSERASELKALLQDAFAKHRSLFDERQMQTLKILQDTLLQGASDNRKQIKESLFEHAQSLGERLKDLSKTTEHNLLQINQQVEHRLTKGFEKTTEIFNDVIKRLALIDSAQQKITELSSNVVTLQEILSDKRSRGAFGEVQLGALIQNMIPKQHYSFQHQLKNNKRPDCMLFLPEPTGNIAIDAKFPLESYRQMLNKQLNEQARQSAERQFKLDIRKHIQDIAEKYIVPGETADGAVMFIPAEAVFAEIHANHDDLIEHAHKAKVWLVSPTTMMAILTTARAVLKDAATRKQVHEIQKHLHHLSEDFERFQMRMDNLAKRIAQAHSDVEQVHISSRKISQRFCQIERAEFETLKDKTPIIPKELDAEKQTISLI